MENKCLKDIYSDDESNDENNINNIKDNSDIINQEEELIFNPYNVNNKEILINNVQSILNKYGIFAKPFNHELYKRARAAANSFYWLDPHTKLNQEELEKGCGLGKKGTKACTEGKTCIEFIGYTKNNVQYYPGKKLLH